MDCVSTSDFKKLILVLIIISFSLNIIQIPTLWTFGHASFLQRKITNNATFYLICRNTHVSIPILAFKSPSILSATILAAYGSARESYSIANISLSSLILIRGLFLFDNTQWAPSHGSYSLMRRSWYFTHFSEVSWGCHSDACFSQLESIANCRQRLSSVNHTSKPKNTRIQ